MLTDKQKTFLDQVIMDERINKARLYKYLCMHDVVGSEVFSYCIEDDREPGRVKISRFLNDDDEYYQPLNVDDFVKRAPFFFFIRNHGANQTYKYGDYCDLLAASYNHFHTGKNESTVNLEKIYNSLEFAYYGLNLSTDKVFGYWIDQTGQVSGNLFYQWIDYLHLCIDTGETDYFPKCFIYAYNIMLCKSGRDPIVYEVSESGIGDPYLRDGLTFSFEGRFPHDPNGNPVMGWIGIRTNNVFDVTCTCEKSKMGYLRFTVSPQTMIYVLNFYNHCNDDDDYWYQVYAGPQTMRFDHTVLKERRTKMKLTQQQVADAVETSIRTYQKWESGETTPDGHYLLRLLNWLDITNVQDAVKFISLAK